MSNNISPLSETKTIALPWNLDGKRLDVAAQTISEAWFSPGLPRSVIQEAIKDGAIIIRGSQVNPGVRVSKGDPITFTENFFKGVTRMEDREFPEGEEPVLLRETEDFIVLYKPASWLTHGVSDYPAEASLEDWILKKGFISQEEAPLLLNNGRVHRLDRNTSGIVIYAKTRSAQEELKRLFQWREVTKTYIALTEGHLPELSGTINAPIMRKQGSFKRIASLSEEPGAKPAETSYRVIARTPEYDLVVLTPKTGRTHQIRAHMEYLGHPLAGDSLYGGKKTLIDRQFLHAWSLNFVFHDQDFTFTAPLPKDLKKIFSSLDESTLTRYDNEALQSIGLKQRKGFFSFMRR